MTPKRKIPFQPAKKKSAHLVQHHPLKPPHCPGDLSEGAGDEGKWWADYLCHLYVPWEICTVSIPSNILSFVLDWRNKLQRGKRKQESLEPAWEQGKVFPRLFYLSSSFLQFSAIRRMGQISDNHGSQVSTWSSRSEKIIQRPSAPRDQNYKVTWNPKGKI